MLEDAEPASRAPIARPIAAGRGWAINDVVCRLGPQNRSEEERFGSATIAVVLDGLFECRSSAGTALLYPSGLFSAMPARASNAGTITGSATHHPAACWMAPVRRFRPFAGRAEPTGRPDSGHSPVLR